MQNTIRNPSTLAISAVGAQARVHVTANALGRSQRQSFPIWTIPIALLVVFTLAFLGYRIGESNARDAAGETARAEAAKLALVEQQSATSRSSLTETARREFDLTVSQAEALETLRASRMLAMTSEARVHESETAEAFQSTANAEQEEATRQIRTGTASAQKTNNARLTQTRAVLQTEAVFTQFRVVSDQDWQLTGFLVPAGKTVTIHYISGRWSSCAPKYGYNCDYYSATGWPNTDMGSNNTLLNCPHAALIGRIGNEKAFCIREDFTTLTEFGGELALRINDENVSDDDGALLVQIRVID